MGGGVFSGLLGGQVGGTGASGAFGFNYMPTAWYGASVIAPTGSDILVNRNVMVAVPILPTQTIVVKKIGIRLKLAHATSSVRLGIYADNGANRPGKLLHDLGSQTTAVATHAYKKTAGVQLTAKPYWLAAARQGSYAGATWATARAIPSFNPGSAGVLDTTLHTDGVLAWISTATVTGVLPATFPVTTPRVSATVTYLIAVQVT